MADLKTKITQLEQGTPVDSDIIPFVDVSDTTQSSQGSTKYALKSELKGEKGDTGDQGIQGEQGLQGDQGIQGIQGIQGDQGLQGDQGIQGEKGDTGERGVTWRNAYDGGTSYVADDGISYNGSSYICILATTGNIPTNTTYWELLAQKGNDGTNGVDGADGSDATVNPTNVSAAGAAMLADANTFTSTGDTSFAGNVGIGTTSPEYRLSFGVHSADKSLALYEGNGAGGSPFYGFGANDFATKVWANNVNIASFTSTGLGIGTTSPGEKLEVTGNINVNAGAIGAGIFGKSGATQIWSMTRGNVSNGDLNLSAYGGFNLNVRTSGAPIVGLRVDTAGNVGIGTTSPGEKLDVNGNIQLSGEVNPSETWNTMSLVNNWAVTAGYGTPRYKIDAMGNVEIQATIGSGTATGFTTLPVAARPKQKLEFFVYDSSGGKLCTINTNGVCVLATGATRNAVNITYSVR